MLNHVIRMGLGENTASIIIARGSYGPSRGVARILEMGGGKNNSNARVARESF